MRQITGMRGYMVIWAGQFFSGLGGGMTAFALSLWLWQETHSATALALIPLLFFLPQVFVTPVVGALVDRWNHHLKRLMMIGDAARLLSSVAMLALLASGHLSLPWVYALVFLEAVTGAFQWPADSAATTVMLRKEDHARAGGIQNTANSASTILAPMLAALLYDRVGLRGIVALDMIGGVIALLSLLPVFVPTPPRSEAGAQAQAGLLQEALYGFRFILREPSLLALQLVFLFGNLLNGVTMALHRPMILARTNDNATILATTQTAGGISGILVGLLITAWGGPRRRIHGVLLGWAVSMTAVVVNGAGQSLTPWLVAALIGALGAPVTNSSNQAIWQSKTPPDVQGKVFAARRVIAMLALPASTLIAGPLADHVMTPAMLPGGPLVPIFGPLVGVGPGAGIAVMSLITGVSGILVMLAMYAVPRVRDVEVRVPDFDEAPRTGPPEGEGRAQPA